VAHEIDTTVNAQGAAIYANVPAWHGLGTVLDHAFTSDEALALAGVDDFKTALAERLVA